MVWTKSQRAYAASSKGIEARKRYMNSSKAKETRKAYYAKRKAQKLSAAEVKEIKVESKIKETPVPTA